MVVLNSLVKLQDTFSKKIKLVLCPTNALQLPYRVVRISRHMILQLLRFHICQSENFNMNFK
jgi:hypothetical protein